MTAGRIAKTTFFRALKMVWGLNAWNGSQIVKSVEPSGLISLGKEFAVGQVLVESPAKGAKSGTHLAAHRNKERHYSKLTATMAAE